MLSILVFCHYSKKCSTEEKNILNIGGTINRGFLLGFQSVQKLGLLLYMQEGQPSQTSNLSLARSLSLTLVPSL